ncbi:glucose 1-dehydrogenase [Parasphingorhabdus sp.]|uniref:SDR family NAD(P)-dependent oxidoreductase n=1 Tax=Parasphingorhabdus sp. TaxID=2709688 RepID=UPI0009ED1CD6
MMTDGLSLEGKVALVTGAARGIGREIANRLAQHGARVVLTDVEPELGKEAAAAMEGATYRDLDVTSQDQWEKAIQALRDKHGRLDVLVNNAGISPAANIEQTDLDLWRRVQTINVESVFLGCRTALPLMRQSGDGGSIVNLSSIQGLRPAAPLAAYSASKAAVRALTKSVALHAAGDQIRCNSVHPGGVQTRMLNDFAALTGDADAALAQMNAANPLGRVGQPIDIANGVVYLASDMSIWVTGLELVIDGGSTL